MRKRTKKLHELVQSRNQAEALIHSVKKSLDEHGDKLDAAEKEKIEAALKEAEEAVKGDDKAAIDAKAEELGKASQNWVKWCMHRHRPKRKKVLPTVAQPPARKTTTWWTRTFKK